MFDHLNLPTEIKPGAWNWFLVAIFLFGCFESALSHRYLNAMSWLLFAVLMILTIYRYPRTLRNARIVIVSILCIAIGLSIVGYFKHLHPGSA